MKMQKEDFKIWKFYIPTEEMFLLNFFKNVCRIRANLFALLLLNKLVIIADKILLELLQWHLTTDVTM